MKLVVINSKFDFNDTFSKSKLSYMYHFQVIITYYNDTQKIIDFTFDSLKQESDFITSIKNGIIPPEKISCIPDLDNIFYINVQIINLFGDIIGSVKLMPPTIFQSFFKKLSNNFGFN